MHDNLLSTVYTMIANYWLQKDPIADFCVISLPNEQLPFCLYFFQ